MADQLSDQTILNWVFDSVAHALKVEQQFTHKNVTASGSTNVLTGAGFLHAVTFNTPTASAVTTVFDNVAASGINIAQVTMPNTLLSDGPKTALYNVNVLSGITLSNTLATNVTVSFR